MKRLAVQGLAAMVALASLTVVGVSRAMAPGTPTDPFRPATAQWLDQAGGVDIMVQSRDAGVTSLDFRIGESVHREVGIDGDVYWTLDLGDEANLARRGEPALPNVCRSLIVPDRSKMRVRVVSSEYREIENVRIAPSKGTLLRTVDPSEVPYEFGEVYDRDAWYPGELASLDAPYILRDYRGQVVRVFPFQYNPVRHTLRVYTDISVVVEPAGAAEINAFDRPAPPEAVAREFKRVYRRHFLNYETARYSVLPEEPGRMLVITAASCYTDMLPFVAWKNRKGLPTEMVLIGDIGNNENSIKDYIRSEYQAKGLTYVLLVGDIGQVTSFEFRYGFENGASDPTYSYLAGNDHYPDLFVGRFSAQNASQAQTQAQRSVEYERSPLSGAWMHQGSGLASNECPGDDGERDWEHIRNIRTDLMGYTYTAVDEFYDGSHGGQDAGGNPTTTMVSNALNDGRGAITYCGHGWSGGWGTSGYGVGNINGLVNDDMLPFIWSVACLNGAFDDVGACFAEGWLRATDNGAPTGAIGAFMSSINQSWNPPMDGEDEMVDILVESVHNNDTRSYGGISFNGCMHMNDRYGGQGNEMTDTWHLFGDPSLEVRTDTPLGLTATWDATIPEETNAFEVMVPGVADALVAASRDNVTLGTGRTDASGHAFVALDAPVAPGADLDVVVSGYNRIPFEGTVGLDQNPAPTYIDDGGSQFFVLSGGWSTMSWNGTYGDAVKYIMPGVGDGQAAWRVDRTLAPGTYDVYVWKFEHPFQHLVATDAHYQVHDATGISDWILVDQSTAGTEWVLLGTFTFDDSQPEGVLLSDQADGVVVADAMKFVPVP